jgi:GTP cyclohydrolase II
MTAKPDPHTPAQATAGREGTTLEDNRLESVERAMAELRRGGAVVVTGKTGADAVLVRAAETVDSWPLAFFTLPGVGAIALAVTERRAFILGLDLGLGLGFAQTDVRAVQLDSSRAFTPESLRALIDPEIESPHLPPHGISATHATADSAVDAAVRLAKTARLLPAVIVAPITPPAESWAQSAARLVVNCAAIEAYDRDHAQSLQPISEARVPLAGSENTRIISFRPRDGGAEHLAIVIGTPEANKPVLVRLHSECFTGDLLASLRCDCGDQLRGAVTTIAAAGGGVLLYLAQEGRGIGLVNKLRAYTLQDKGFDTVDANEQLGFDDDERVYLPAVRMLRHLGFERVRLLTNNPAKVGALVRHGIDVVERVPHAFASNAHNATYLQTKAKRSGHLF